MRSSADAHLLWLTLQFRDVFLSAIPTAQKLREFKALIVQMPRPNQYLLLYVLDLLGAVAKDSETNRMTSPSRWRWGQRLCVELTARSGCDFPARHLAPPGA